MNETATPHQALAEMLLGQPVVEYIAALRKPEARHSWRLISNKLKIATDGKVDVAPETLRQWFLADLAEAS